MVKIVRFKAQIARKARYFEDLQRRTGRFGAEIPCHNLIKGPERGL